MPQSLLDPDKFLTNNDLAAMLGLKSGTPVAWRATSHGPKFLRVGRKIYYRRSDVDAWLESQVRDPDQERHRNGKEG